MDLPKVIALLHRKMNTELSGRLKEIGLTTAKARMIKHIYQNGEMTQADLCRELDLDKSTVAKTLSRMEDRGLITKQVKPDAAHSFLVSLTPKAEEIMPEAQEIIAGWNQDVTSSMTEQEQELFQNLLRKVARQAGEINK